MPVTSWMPARDVDTLAAVGRTAGWGKVTGFNQSPLIALVGTEVQADDSDKAAFLQVSGSTTEYLVCSDFDFAGQLPLGATITGVEVEGLIQKDSSGTYAVTNTEVFEWLGGASGAAHSSNFGALGDWPTTETPTSYSAASSTSRSDAVTTGYGCAFSVTVATGRNSLTSKHLIDRVRMRLTYTVNSTAAKRGKGAKFL